MDPNKAARNIQCEDCGHTRENHDHTGCLVWINADANNKCKCTVIDIKFVHIRKAVDEKDKAQEEQGALIEGDQEKP